MPLYTPVGELMVPMTLPHRLRPTGTHYRRPVSLWDVYVEDFLGLVQGNKYHRKQVKLSLLHALDSAMYPLDANDSNNFQEPTSLKNMGKGGAIWATVKTILGWILDTVQKIISLRACMR
jgi:hypothetical protein